MPSASASPPNFDCLEKGPNVLIHLDSHHLIHHLIHHQFNIIQPLAINFMYHQSSGVWGGAHFPLILWRIRSLTWGCGSLRTLYIAAVMVTSSGHVFIAGTDFAQTFWNNWDINDVLWWLLMEYHGLYFMMYIYITSCCQVWVLLNMGAPTTTIWLIEHLEIMMMERGSLVKTECR